MVGNILHLPRVHCFSYKMFSEKVDRDNSYKSRENEELRIFFFVIN
jgi:hypothetical protein